MRTTREIVMASQRLRNEMQGLRYILFDETNYKNTDLSRFGPVYPKLGCHLSETYRDKSSAI